MNHIGGAEKLERYLDYLTRKIFKRHHRPRMFERMIRTTQITGFLITLLVIGSTFAGSLAGQDLPTDIEPALSDPPTDQAQAGLEDDFVHPSEVAKEAFGDPKGASRMAKLNLWVDKENGRVYFDGYVTMRTGPLEMLACQSGTKEHESVIAVLHEHAQLETAYGGGFVRALNGIEASIDGGKNQDWFYYVNGVLMSEVKDLDPEKRSTEGLLGVQVHVGPPMKIEYRAIRLKPLTPPAAK